VEKGHLILRCKREGLAVVEIVVELNCARHLGMDESCRCLIPNNVVAYSNKKYWMYLTILHPYDTTCIRILKWSKSPLLNFADIIIFFFHLKYSNGRYIISDKHSFNLFSC